MRLLPLGHLLPLLLHISLPSQRSLPRQLPAAVLLRLHPNLHPVLRPLQDLHLKVLLPELPNWLPEQRLLLQQLSAWYLRQPQHLSLPALPRSLPRVHLLHLLLHPLHRRTRGLPGQLQLHLPQRHQPRLRSLSRLPVPLHQLPQLTHLFGVPRRIPTLQLTHLHQLHPLLPQRTIQKGQQVLHPPRTVPQQLQYRPRP